MTFGFLHSRHEEQPILVPQIGLELRVRIPTTATAGMLTLVETANAPGFGPPLHRHRETEIFYTIVGRYLYEVDGKRFVAEAGDLVTVPGGCAHAFVNIADAPGRQLVQFLPGLDAAEFFLGLSKVMQDEELDRDALNAFAKAWHMEFLGPPLNPGG